ncbi:hypothetical protein BpHYR1_037051 [Brachionus plicatilis]|uniref:Uncharacterized protein n=1 Tax=Brachionus plicatilis TaxID=10195 RepID=A0A3M7SM80_BRAPC|nr:hypothetical protein BpHYR1_037051 [Brachionus plicatilis]
MKNTRFYIIAANSCHHLFTEPLFLTLGFFALIFALIAVEASSSLQKIEYFEPINESIISSDVQKQKSDNEDVDPNALLVRVLVLAVSG